MAVGTSSLSVCTARSFKETIPINRSVGFSTKHPAALVLLRELGGLGDVLVLRGIGVRP
jgi:hypothetical protein